MLKQIRAAQSLVGGERRDEISKETNASGVRTQHDGCKESTAGGAIWKKGRAEIPLGKAPKDGDAKGEERERRDIW